MKRDEIHTKSGYKSLLQALQKVLQWILIKGVRLYQLIISPWLGPSCRHSPTCSTYMIQAIKEWGAIRGFWLGIKRIAKCHPWGTSGFDPVPKRKNKNSEYSP